MVSIDRYLPVLSSCAPAGPAAPAEWTPANLDLDEWQRADAGISVASGSPVATWADQSGNGRDQTQPTAGLQPTYISNGLNGRPTVSYLQGNLEYTQSTLNADSVPSIAVAWVWRPNMINSTGLWSWSTMTSDGTPFLQARQIDSGDIAIYTSGVLLPGMTQGNLTANAWILTWDGETWSAYKDGVLQGSAAGLASASPRGQFIFLANANTGYGTVDYSEFLVSKLALSATDITNLSAYFRNKWGTP